MPYLLKRDFHIYSMQFRVIKQVSCLLATAIHITNDNEISNHVTITIASADNTIFHRTFEI